MQQTTYAQVRSRDPRNTFYGVNPGAASASPYMARPIQTADVSMYQRPAVPSSLAGLVSQAEEDQNAMINPGFQQRLMEQQNRGIPTSLQGIDIGEPAPVVTNPDLSTDQGLQDAGLMPSDPLPVTPPTKPLEAGPMEFTPSQVEQAQGVVNTLAQGQDTGDGMAAATRAKDQERVNNDIMQVAKAKNPSEAWNKLQKEPFYQNSSFYTGLMGVGLSIMSGKSPIEAFQIGQGMANQDETKKQLEANRDALIEQGFSQDSIAAAIANGDPSLLKMKAIDPAQKEAWYAAREERQNAEWDRRQTINEASAEKSRKATLENQLALAEARGEITRDNQLFKSEHSVRRTSPKWEKSEELGGITPNLRDKLQQSYRPVINVLASRNKWMAPTEAAISKLGTGANSQENAAQQRAAIENLTKLIQGGLASINGEVMNELTGDPDWVNNKLNKIQMMAGQGPTEANIKWLKALGTEIQEIDKEATKYQVAPLVESLMLDSGLAPDNAIRAANSIFAPGSVRLTTEEFKEWSRGHSKVHDKTFPDDKPSKLKGGALSGSSDTSWFTK